MKNQRPQSVKQVVKYEKSEGRVGDKRLETWEGAEHVGHMGYIKNFGLYSKTMGSYEVF